MDMKMRWTRVAVATGAALVLLLVLCAVLLSMLIGQGERAADERDHARIVAICDKQYDSMTEVVAWVECIEELKE